MTDAIIYHGAITTKGVLQTERVLASYANKAADSLDLSIVSGGGDTAAAAALRAMIKAMPIKVRTFTSGMCASGGVSVFVAGSERITSPAAMFMLHGAKASDGSLSQQAGILRETFRYDLGWDDTRLDEYFLSVDEKWFPPADAIRMGIATGLGEFSIERGAALHIIEA